MSTGYKTFLKAIALIDQLNTIVLSKYFILFINLSIEIMESLFDLIRINVLELMMGSKICLYDK